MRQNVECLDATFAHAASAWRGTVEWFYFDGARNFWSHWESWIYTYIYISLSVLSLRRVRESIWTASKVKVIQSTFRYCFRTCERWFLHYAFWRPRFYEMFQDASSMVGKVGTLSWTVAVSEGCLVTKVLWRFHRRLWVWVKLENRLILNECELYSELVWSNLVGSDFCNGAAVLSPIRFN